MDISGAPDSYLHNDVSYSYGSPMTAADIVTYGAWDVWTSGAVEFYNGYAFSSYGLYSPDTSDIQFVWMVFPSGFINHNLDYTISYSYGALRTWMAPTVRIMSTQMVASPMTTTVSLIPTGEKQTSPDMSITGGAWFALPAGNLDGNYYNGIDSSYGIWCD